MAAPSTSSNEEYFLKHHWRFDIDGIAVARFQKCTGVDSKYEVVEIKEGGSNYAVAKVRGMQSFEPITLNIGVTKNDTLRQYFENGTKFSASLVELDNKLNDAYAWDLFDCWISAFKTGDRGTESEQAVDEFVVVYTFYKPRKLK